MSVAVPFTQYLLPDGRKRPNVIDLPDELAAPVKALLEAGCVFEVEILSAGDPFTGMTHESGAVSLTCERGEDILAAEIVPNGPGVKEAVIRMIKEAYGMLVDTKDRSDPL